MDEREREREMKSIDVDSKKSERERDGERPRTNNILNRVDDLIHSQRKHRSVKNKMMMNLARNMSRVTRTSAIRNFRSTAWVSSDRIAVNDEQATGREKEEIEASSKGEKRFSVDPILSHFGTISNPVQVKSGMNSRVIGCTGGREGTDKYHDVLWFNLEKGMPHMCSCCGQVFELVDA